MDIVFSDGDLYEVLMDNKDRHIVNFGVRDCECGVWKIFGLAYVHAFRCIDEIRKDYGKYISIYLTKEYYLRTYKEHITPIPSEIKWPWVLDNERDHQK